MTVNEDESGKKAEDQFEFQLKEILDYGEGDVKTSRIERVEKGASFHAGVGKGVSCGTENIIRIVAALLVIGLLICFGVQIAFR